MARNDPPESAGYDVGYGKPPAAHRFRKGRSGNPKGRPKGARNKVPKGQGLDFGTQPANQMLLEEAYRTITVREGERTIELPVIQAVFRSLGVSAMKGNRLAQATMAELVRNIEEEDRRIRASLFETACEYKFGWQRAFEHARKNGLPDPDVVPHPDDVVLDMRRAEVRCEGPMRLEEKAQFDRAIAVRDEAQTDVSHWAQRFRQSRKPDTQQHCLEMWHMDQKLFDTINEALPPRYRSELVNRSYAEGASRRGEFQAKYRAHKK